MQMAFDDFNDELEGTTTIDVCPSCGALLNGFAELGDGCNDPLGCGNFDEEAHEEDTEDDYGVEELDFDN